MVDRMNTQEREWVANTVEAVSGIYPAYLCGPDAKLVPTHEQSGATACQEGFAVFLTALILDSMRLPRLGATNKRSVA